MCEKLAEILYDLFVVNKYAAAIQQPDGRYLTKYFELSPLIIQKCLEKRGSIGCYQQLYKSKFLKWICFDFDCSDKENPDINLLKTKYIRPFIQCLKEMNINYLVEFSGRRGIHIWIIFNDFLNKSIAFEIVNRIMTRVKFIDMDYDEIDLDLFPSTPNFLGNKLGKQVKLPLSCHKKGGRSYFYKNNLEDIDIYSDDFYEEQYDILLNYKSNDVNSVLRTLLIDEKLIDNNKLFIKYKLIEDLECSVDEVIKILSKTNVYKRIIERMLNGKSLAKDWFVMLGTLGPIDINNDLLIEFFKYSPNFNMVKTKKYINEFKDKYCPATFKYLYRIYGLDIEKGLDANITGLEYLLLKLNKRDILEKIEVDKSNFISSERKLINDVGTILNKEINYILSNDEVIPISIYNDLKRMTRYDLNRIEKTALEIKQGNEIREWQKQWIVYTRKESDIKERTLVSLGAYDRILTSYLINIFAYNINYDFKSYSYNLNFNSKDDMFFYWYTSWGNFIEQISNYLEIKYMDDYNILVLDIKKFYDSIDLLSIYESFSNKLDEENRNILKFLVNYNSELMRKVNYKTNSRIGVAQGPAYSRVLAEMYLSSILGRLEESSKQDIEGHYKLFRYVDDIVIIYDDCINGEILLNDISKLLNINGLSINKLKSCVYGKIKNLTDVQRNHILRKEKFDYDLRKSNVSFLIDENEIYDKTIERINKKKEFDIGDVNYIFSNYTDRKSMNIYLSKFDKLIFSSDIGRGTAFKKFYTYILSEPLILKKYLIEGYFKLIPVNSINFKTLISQLYLMIQDNKLDINNIKNITKYFLEEIILENIDNEDDRGTIKALIKYGGYLR